MTNKKFIHIRNLKPGFNEYKNMDHQFRPYLMFSNAENYQTKIVNTDRLGFRKTFYKIWRAESKGYPTRRSECSRMDR